MKKHTAPPKRRGRKPKFRPEITRIKLDPEQAVISCVCYAEGYNYRGAGTRYWAGGSFNACNAVGVKDTTLMSSADICGRNSTGGCGPYFNLTAAVNS